jgi:hypothetical protein
MGLDDTVNLERLASAFEKIADALTRLATVEERKNPPERPKRAAEITRTDDDKREQYSDKASDEWLKETKEALPKSRFQERLDKQSAEPSKERAAPQSRRPS